MVLTAANTYNGITTIEAGTTDLTGTGSINGGAVTVTGGTLSLAGSSTINATSGGTVNVNSGTLITYSINDLGASGVLGFDTTNASGGSFAIADVLADTSGAAGGARGLTKLGTNGLTLSGPNTYTGATTVSNGTLQISGTTNTTAGNVTVGSGSAGTLTVANGGALTTTVTLQLGSGNTGNAFNVNAGGTMSVGTFNNSWGTDVVLYM